MEHCLQANYCMYKMICHSLREQANGVEVSYHATSVKLMEVHLTAFVSSNLSVEHCLQANYCMYKMICHILREQANGVEVSYHATSVKLMEVHLVGEFLPSMYFTFLVGWWS
jgi:hypothetical protein